MSVENEEVIKDEKELEQKPNEKKADDKVDDDNKGKEGEDKEDKELTDEEKQELEDKKKEKLEKKQKMQSRLDRRFSHLTNKVKSAHSDVASWRETLKEVTGEEPPTREDYATPEEFEAAKSEYRDKIRGPKSQLEHAQKKAAEAEAEYDQALVDTWGDKVDEVLEELPDYKEKVAKAKLPLTPEMTKALLRSNVGPKIAYYLAENQDEAYDILDLPPNEQIQAIGRLEIKVQAERSVDSDDEVKVEKKKKEPNPPPTGEKPKGEKQTQKKDPATMSLEEYSKWRKQGGGS